MRVIYANEAKTIATEIGYNGEIIDYYVDEEKRTVAAVMSVDKGAVAHELLDIVSKESFSAFLFSDIDFKNTMTTKSIYRGIAKCSPNDKFDAEKGMQIAKLKAVDAYMKDRERLARTITGIFERVQKRIIAAEEFNHHCREHIAKKLSEF